MTAHRFLPFWWLLLAGASVGMRLVSEGIIDSGDGIQHYHIARGSWSSPMLLLDHWGKPLFTLFASPFAQLGLWSMTLFNALCFVFTCWAADGVIRSQSHSLRWLFAPLLLLAPEYGRMVLAGMTEPFFGLIAMLALRALHERRFLVAALISSFMPFARPEYIAFVPFVAAWLIMQKSWRTLPVLLTGHMVYALLGWVALADPLWYFHRDPYTGAESVYGRGDAWHFVQSLPETLGWPLLLLVITSVIMTSAHLVRHRSLSNWQLFIIIVALLPSLTILLVHTILWWKGLKGSLGLTRVLATAAPLLALFAIAPVGALLDHSALRGFRRIMATTAIGMAAIGYSAYAFFDRTPWPYPIDGYQRFLRDVGEQVRVLADSETRVVFFHPMIAYRSGLNPYDTDHARQCWGLDAAAPATGLADHDLLVWDAHFGPNEGGTPLDLLLNRADLELVSVMVPDERMLTLGDHPFEVWIFRPGAASSNEHGAVLFDQSAREEIRIQWRADTLPCASPTTMLCLAPNEFPLELLTTPLIEPGALYREVHVSARLSIGACEKVSADLVYAESLEEQSLMYFAWPVRDGRLDIRFRAPRRDLNTNAKLYLWNMDRCALAIDSLRVSVRDIERAPSVTPPRSAPQPRAPFR